jgi:hypothetical protein
MMCIEGKKGGRERKERKRDKQGDIAKVAGFKMFSKHECEIWHVIIG